MAEGLGNNVPSMNWKAMNLDQEFRRFKLHCDFVFDGPLASKNAAAKAGYVMTWLGDKGREIYSTMTWAPAVGENAAENKTPEGIFNKFENYVKPKKNTIRATVEFNRRKQEATERFDDFVTALKLLARDCDFGTMEERMIRDAIVLRSKHPAVMEKSFEKGDDLTLEGAVKIGQDYETSQASMQAINKDEDLSVSKIFIKKKDKRKWKSKPHEKSKSEAKRVRKCIRCGYDESHTRCPAKGAKCGYCNVKGHFAKMCLKRKSTHAVEVEDDERDCTTDDEESETEHCTYNMMNDDDSDSEEEYVCSTNNGDGKWWENISLHGKDCKVHIDTGAKKSLMSEETYKSLPNPKPELKPTSQRFRSYTKHPLQVLGKTTVNLKHNKKCVKAKIFVIKLDQCTLLSGDHSEALGLVKRIYAVKEMTKSLQEIEDMKTTGTLPGKYTIKVDPSVKPVVHGPRRQPQALKKLIIEKLDEMESNKAIVKCDEPTDWVNSMVVVVKESANKTKKVRICLDPRDLNKAVKREHHPAATIEDVISSIPNAKVFSVLDAQSGFLQIELDYESSLLTTFNTPVGRYRWLRLPFGIKCAPEIFQRIMDKMLEGIQGARAIMDDILVAAETVEEHDRILKEVIRRATEYNLKLNFDKCQVRQSEVKYVGHLVTAEGLKVDPNKVKAVVEMPRPENKDDVRRFLGFVQYVAKFVPNLSEVDEPLRALVKKDVEFYWEKPQIEAFSRLKKLCTEAPVLKFFDVNKDVTIQCDASSTAVGAVLLQEGQPIAYTSRSLSATETRYAQIEKETLAIVHACKKFHYYIFGKEVAVESDHKPLQAIFTKPILDAPMRLQAMMLRLQRYDLKVKYVPGQQIPVGDALSRASLQETEPDMKPITVNMVDHIAISEEKYRAFQTHTANELSELHHLILKGWPDTKNELPHSVREYWTVRDELSVSDGIVYRGMRLVVPPSLRKAMLQYIHRSHYGIVKCRSRAKETLYWPGMNAEIEDLVTDCPECQKLQNKQEREEMISMPVPEIPWVEVGTDIFEFKGEHFILTVDYFSKFIEVDKLPDMSSASTVTAIKRQLSTHGIPLVIRSDNGPQFSSKEFATFCSEWEISHVTSSPHLPRSNGEAERSIQTIKKAWKKNTDQYLAVLDYNTTPLESCGLSPAQLAMSRRPRNMVPTAKKLLEPSSYNLKRARKDLQSAKDYQKECHDRKHSKTLPVLQPGDPVQMAPLPGTDIWLPARVIRHHNTPRSYVVEYQGRKYRRNREHLRLTTYQAQENSKLALRRDEKPQESEKKPTRKEGPNKDQTIAMPPPKTNEARESPGLKSPVPVREKKPQSPVREKSRKESPERKSVSPVKENQPVKKSTEVFPSPRKSRSGRILKSTRNPDFEY